MAPNPRSAKITKRVIDALTPEGARYTVWDAQLKGFGVRVAATDTRTYVVRYRTIGGADRLLQIARHGVVTAEEARERAAAVLAQVASGGDPQGTKFERREELTMAGLCDLYMAEGTALKKASTLQIDKIRIARHIKPRLGRMKITDITRRDIERLMVDVGLGQFVAQEPVALVEEQGPELLAGLLGQGDLDAAADMMVRTLHRLGPEGVPEVHPFISTAVKGYAAMHDRFRTSVQGTARSYLKWLAGDDLVRAMSASDFALGDLMCAEAPVSLYVQVAPADAVALRPVIRLLFYAAAQALTAAEHADDAGREKRRRLLMLMDEFPLLGRLAFFEKSLRLMSGYGIKTMFVAQSLNDIVETYGANNTILDNCHVYTPFNALDPLTQDKVSKLTGAVLERKTSRSGPAGLGAGRSSVSRSEIERPLLEPGEIRALPDEVQLTFVAGRRPLRTHKVLYDRERPFRTRADLPPPDQSAGVDTPGAPVHPWAGRRGLGEDPEAALPLFKEVEAAIHDRRVAAKAAETYERISTAFAAEQAVLDGLQGGGDGRA